MIDDEAIVRRVLAEFLERQGYDVLAAANAEEALALLDETLALVISDIQMPGSSGLQLLEAIRDRRPNLPVILCTGAPSGSALLGAAAGGAEAYLVKPFSQAELTSAVTAALARGAARAAFAD